MVRHAILDTFKYSWPIFVIILIIIISFYIVDSIINKKKIIFYKDILKLSFICYILCLFYIVSFDDVDWSTSNFELFKEISRYNFGSRLFAKNVLNNVLMFIPYGFFVNYFLQSKNIKPILFLSVIVSLTIEITQLLIGRVFDIDDILLNVLGAIIGYIIYKLLLLFKKILPPFLKSDWFYNIISVLVIIMFILYIFNVFNLGVLPW